MREMHAILYVGTDATGAPSFTRRSDARGFLLSERAMNKSGVRPNNFVKRGNLYKLNNPELSDDAFTPEGYGRRPFLLREERKLADENVEEFMFRNRRAPMLDEELDD